MAIDLMMMMTTEAAAAAGEQVERKWIVTSTSIGAHCHSATTSLSKEQYNAIEHQFAKTHRLLSAAMMESTCKVQQRTQCCTKIRVQKLVPFFFIIQ